MPEVWTGLCTLCFHLEYQPPLTLLHMFGFISNCGTSQDRVCVGAVPVCPSLLWHLPQSLLLLPLGGLHKCLELPFLSFSFSAFLCAGLKKNCWEMGRLLQLFLPQLYVLNSEESWVKICFMPFLPLTSSPVSASCCKLNHPAICVPSDWHHASLLYQKYHVERAGMWGWTWLACSRFTVGRIPESKRSDKCELESAVPASPSLGDCSSVCVWGVGSVGLCCPALQSQDAVCCSERSSWAMHSAGILVTSVQVFRICSKI